MKEEERRRRPPEKERDTHTHQSQGEILNGPSCPPSTHSPVKFQTKAATSKQGEIFSRVGSLPASGSSSRLLLPIYPS
jgi:hypothetical protein